MQCNINTEQRRECLVDAHGRDIKHRRWYRVACCGIVDETDVVAHHLHEGRIAAIRTYCEDALVRVVDVYTLEMVREPWQLAQTAIANSPVRKQTRERWEDVERLSWHAGIRSKECWYHHVAAV